MQPLAEKWASAPEIKSKYNIIVQGGGSGTGAKKTCLEREHPDHVDIGLMSRNWKTNEAVFLDDGYTMECVQSKIRFTHIAVGIDGVAVVVPKGGHGHDCITNPSVGGLTTAQLRWIYSNWTDDQLAKQGGMVMSSVVPNDNHNGVKEWSDIHSSCQEVPIHAYGEDNISGTNEFFAERTLCASCFVAKTEQFGVCSTSKQEQFMNITSPADMKAFISGSRPHSCVLESPDDFVLLDWIKSDPRGILYIGYSYLEDSAGTITAVRVGDDMKNGAGDTTAAKVEPSPYSIADGSYSILTRFLFMNVDNTAWNVSHEFLQYGFSPKGIVDLRGAGFVQNNIVVQTKMKLRVEEKGNPFADYVIARPNGCPAGTELLEIPFVNKFGFARVNFTCSPCSPGSFKAETTATSCLPCGAGTHSSRSGQSSCDSCLRGTYSLKNQSSCTDCPAGNYSDTKESSACIACSAGSVSAEPRSTNCTICEQGYYQTKAGSTKCTKCPDTMTTPVLGASSLDSCKCPVGTFYLTPFDDSGANCTACLDAMTCLDISVAPPMLQAGHFAGSADPFDIFQCQPEIEPSDQCLAATVGTTSCKGLRTGFLCSQCPDGYVITSSGCEACTSNDLVQLVGIVLACIAFVFILFWAKRKYGAKNVRKQHHGHDPTEATIDVLVDQILNFAQMIQSINQTGINWIGPFVAFMNIANSISLNIQWLNMNCVKVNDVVSGFAIAVAAPIALLLVSSILLGILRLLRVKTPPLDGIICSIGQVLTIAYTSIVLASLTPFQCYKHPNGKQSMISASSVLCWEGIQHQNLIGLSILAILLYVLGIFSWVLYAIRSYPFAVARGDMAFVLRYKFLFGKLSPPCYWFSGLLMFRDFAMSVCPMVFSRDDRDMMVLLMTISMQIVFVLELRFLPFRTTFLNSTEVLLVSAILMILFVSLTLAHQDGLSTMGMSVFLVTWCLFNVIFMGASLLLKFVAKAGKVKALDAFLSYHEQEAVCFARLLSHSLKAKHMKVATSTDVSFTSTFEKVHDSRCLILVLSGQTLSQPHCVGELVMASRAKVQIVPCLTEYNSKGFFDTHQLMSEDQLQHLFHDLEVSLKSSAMYTEDFQQCFASLLTLEMVALNVFQSGEFDSGLEAVVEHIYPSHLRFVIVQKGLGKLLNFKPQTLSDQLSSSCVCECKNPEKSSWFLMADPCDFESGAAARTLQFLMKPWGHVEFDLGLSCHDIEAYLEQNNFEVILVLLNRTSLEHAEYLARLTYVQHALPDISMKPVIFCKSIPHPTTKFYEELAESGSLFGETADDMFSKASGRIMTKLEVSEALRSILKVRPSKIDLAIHSEADFTKALNKFMKSIDKANVTASRDSTFNFRATTAIWDDEAEKRASVEVTEDIEVEQNFEENEAIPTDRDEFAIMVKNSKADALVISVLPDEEDLNPLVAESAITKQW